MIRSFTLAVVCAGALVAADAVDHVLSSGQADSPFLAPDLIRAVESLPAAQRAGAVARIGERRLPASGEVLQHFIVDRDPHLAAASIAALASAWPTTMEDAEVVRQCISSPEVLIADAACAFAVTIGDDGAIPQLITRIAVEPTNAATSNALLRLTSRNASSPQEWRTWWESETQAIRARIDPLAQAIDSGNAQQIEEAMMPLLGERRGASAIAALLVAATSHHDPNIAAAARAGLATCTGPVALVWRSKQKPGLALADIDAPMASTAAAATTEVPLPVPVADNSLGAWLLGLLGAGFVAVLLLMPKRMPEKPLPPAKRPRRATLSV